MVTARPLGVEILTVAFEITAPVGSATVPWMALLFACAYAAGAKAIKEAANRRQKKRRMILVPHISNKHERAMPM